MSQDDNFPTESTGELFTDDVSNIMTDDGVVGESNNSRILYITLLVIVAILIGWIVSIFLTREDVVVILNEMHDAATNLKPVSDVTK